MDKPKAIYRDDGKKEINFIDLNQPITIILASASKFFLEGINKVLRNEKGLIIAWEVQNQEEIEKSLDGIKPDILFIDNRALKFDVRRIFALINPDTRLVLLGDDSRGKLDLPNVTYLTKHTSSSDLILAMRKILYKSTAINIEEYRPNAISSLTFSNLDRPETIIELTEEVFFEDEDKIKVFDDEFSPEEDINSSNEEFDDVSSHDNQEKRMGQDRRVTDFRQLILILLLVFGVIYFGAKYMYPDPELRGFISGNLFLHTDSKPTLEGKPVLPEQGARETTASVVEGQGISSGNVSTEEAYEKIDSLATDERGVKKVENRLAVEKKATAIETSPKAEVVQSVQREINEEPEEEKTVKVSDQNPKNVVINKSLVDEEANESRRLRVLAELENNVKTKENIKVIRTNYEEPGQLGGEDRPSSLSSARDASIARDIGTALAIEGYEDIKVSVNNGEVFLVGEVETHLDHIRLHRIALKTSGVTKIKSVLGVAEYSADPPNIEN